MKQTLDFISFLLGTAKPSSNPSTVEKSGRLGERYKGIFSESSESEAEVPAATTSSSSKKKPSNSASASKASKKRVPSPSPPKLSPQKKGGSGAARMAAAAAAKKVISEIWSYFLSYLFVTEPPF